MAGISSNFQQSSNLQHVCYVHTSLILYAQNTDTYLGVDTYFWRTLTSSKRIIVQVHEIVFFHKDRIQVDGDATSCSKINQNLYAK